MVLHFIFFNVFCSIILFLKNHLPSYIPFFRWNELLFERIYFTFWEGK